jgi:hypothetical protein
MYLHKNCHWTILWRIGVPFKYSFRSDNFNNHFTWRPKCLQRQLETQFGKDHTLEKGQISVLLGYREDLHRQLQPRLIVPLLLQYEKNLHYLEHHISFLSTGTVRQGNEIIVRHSLFVLLNMPAKCVLYAFTLLVYYTWCRAVIPKACNFTLFLALTSTVWQMILWC